MITKTIKWEDQDGVEHQTVVPAKWVICVNCNGSGSSTTYLGAYTRDELDEQGPEFLEDLMSGAYDRPCDSCGGSGKVLIIDEENCTTHAQHEAIQWVEDMAASAAQDRYTMSRESGYSYEG